MALPAEVWQLGAGGLQPTPVRCFHVRRAGELAAQFVFPHSCFNRLLVFLFLLVHLRLFQWPTSLEEARSWRVPQVEDVYNLSFLASGYDEGLGASCALVVGGDENRMIKLYRCTHADGPTDELVQTVRHEGRPEKT